MDSISCSVRITDSTYWRILSEPSTSCRNGGGPTPFGFGLIALTFARHQKGTIVPGGHPGRSCQTTCHMARRGAAVTEPLKNPQRRLSRDMTEATVADTGQYQYFSQFYFRSMAPSEKNTGVGDLNQQARHHKKTRRGILCYRDWQPGQQGRMEPDPNCQNRRKGSSSCKTRDQKDAPFRTSGQLVGWSGGGGTPHTATDTACMDSHCPCYRPT